MLVDFKEAAAVRQDKIRLDEYERRLKEQRRNLAKAIGTVSLVAAIFCVALIAIIALAAERLDQTEEFSGKPLWVECQEAGIPAEECRHG